MALGERLPSQSVRALAAKMAAAIKRAHLRVSSFTGILRRGFAEERGLDYSAVSLGEVGFAALASASMCLSTMPLVETRSPFAVSKALEALSESNRLSFSSPARCSF